MIRHGTIIKWTVLAVAAIGAFSLWARVTEPQVAEVTPPIVERPIGLVLAGGGAKGAYEVGVWKALSEAGLASRVTVISGTSIGAINAALFAAVGESATCEALWREKVPRTMQGVCKAVHGAPNASGGCDSKRLRAEISSGLPDKWREHSPVVYVTALAKDAARAKPFRLNGMERERMIDCVMASAALPGAFDSVIIDGVAYVDGGLEHRGGDDVPLEPIRKNHPEVKDMIVVYLHSKDRVPRRVIPPAGVNVIEIFPSENIDGSRGGLNSIFDFRPATIEKLLRLGYDDARKTVNLETKGKFKPTGGGFTMDRSKVCKEY